MNNNDSESLSEKIGPHNESVKLDKDTNGVGDRMRHLSERSWSSTSSAELSSFSSSQESMPAAYAPHESPISWMPHLALSMREVKFNTNMQHT